MQTSVMHREGSILIDRELNEAIAELEGLLAKYAEEADEQDFCNQCCHPHYDGICNCGRSNDAVVEMAKLLGYRLECYKAVRRERNDGH